MPRAALIVEVDRHSDALLFRLGETLAEQDLQDLVPQIAQHHLLHVVRVEGRRPCLTLTPFAELFVVEAIDIALRSGWTDRMRRLAITASLELAGLERHEQ